MNTRIRFFLAIVFSTFFLFSTGCWDSPAPFVTVQGNVSFNGAPVSGAVLQFYHEGEKETNIGIDVGPGGTFWLSSRNAAGCTPGRYVIVISSEQVPKKYGSVETSDLVVDIKNDMNQLDIELKK